MSDVKKLAALLTGLSRRIEEVANQPRLIAASLPVGESIDIVDPETGAPVLSVGEQFDGTVGAVPLDGPIPPVPSAPLVHGTDAMLTVSWDGRMDSEEDRVPLDWQVTEIWARYSPPVDVPTQEPATVPVPDPEDDPDDPTPPEPLPDLDELPDPFPDLEGATLLGSIPSAAGGTMSFHVEAGTYTVALVTKTVPGRRSAPSPVAVAEVPRGVDREVIQAEMAAARSLIEDVRDRVGRRMWVGVEEPFKAGQYIQWEPLGGGQVRFTALLPAGHEHRTVLWANPDGERVEGEADSRTVIYEYAEPGPQQVHLTITGFVIASPTITVTTEMMDPDYGWVDLTLPLDKITEPGQALDPDRVAEIWTPLIAAGILLITEKIITPEILVDGAVQTRHLNIVPEPDSEGGFYFTPVGYVLLGPDGSEAVRLTTDGPISFGVAKDGEYLATVSEDGEVTGTSVSSRGDVKFDGGRSLVDELGGIGGRTYAKTQLENAVTIDLNRKGLLGATFQLPGRGPRQIKVTVQLQASQTLGAVRSVGLTLHFAQGETVTTGNTVRFPYNDVTSTQNRTDHSFSWSLSTAELGVTNDRAVLSVLLAAASDSGGTWDAHSGAQTYLLVEDMGPAVQTARTVIQTADPTKPAQNTVTPRQDVWLAQGFRTYDGNGNARPEVPHLYQGYTPRYAAGGRRRSVVQFPDLSGPLAGADIEWIEIDIHALHWHAIAGGTISVGVKDGLIPASLPDAAIGAHSLVQVHMGRNKTATIRLPVATHAGIKSGATRLITFFTTSQSGEFYGYFSPSSFKIRARYQK